MCFLFVFVGVTVFVGHCLCGSLSLWVTVFVGDILLDFFTGFPAKTIPKLKTYTSGTSKIGFLVKKLR